MNPAAATLIPQKVPSRSGIVRALDPLSPQTPSLPGPRPRSDRFRCDRRERKLLAGMRPVVGSKHIQVCVSHVASERASICKKIEPVRPRDVTDELVPLPEAADPVLNRGVTLDARKLNLLRNRFFNDEGDMGIHVF